jgi:hypothetical protein
MSIAKQAVQRLHRPMRLGDSGCGLTDPRQFLEPTLFPEIVIDRSTWYSLP